MSEEKNKEEKAKGLEEVHFLKPFTATR